MSDSRLGVSQGKADMHDRETMRCTGKVRNLY